MNEIQQRKKLWRQIQTWRSTQIPDISISSTVLWSSTLRGSGRPAWPQDRTHHSPGFPLRKSKYLEFEWIVRFVSTARNFFRRWNAPRCSAPYRSAPYRSLPTPSRLTSPHRTALQPSAAQHDTTLFPVFPKRDRSQAQLVLIYKSMYEAQLVTLGQVWFGQAVEIHISYGILVMAVEIHISYGILVMAVETHISYGILVMAY